MSDSNELRWLSAENPDASESEQWLLHSAVHSNGTVYIPGGAFGDEAALVMCAGFDGVGFVYDDGHPYFPTSWMAEQFPRDAGSIRDVEAKLLKHIRDRKTNGET